VTAVPRWNHGRVIGSQAYEYTRTARTFEVILSTRRYAKNVPARKTDRPVDAQLAAAAAIHMASACSFRPTAEIANAAGLFAPNGKAGRSIGGSYPLTAGYRIAIVPRGSTNAKGHLMEMKPAAAIMLYLISLACKDEDHRAIVAGERDWMCWPPIVEMWRCRASTETDQPRSNGNDRAEHIFSA